MDGSAWSQSWRHTRWKGRPQRACWHAKSGTHAAATSSAAVTAAAAVADTPVAGADTSKMLGGASQIVSMIRVQGNGKTNNSPADTPVAGAGCSWYA